MGIVGNVGIRMPAAIDAASTAGALGGQRPAWATGLDTVGNLGCCVTRHVVWDPWHSNVPSTRCVEK